ncbi:MAG: DUF4145 domain-containing protein [Candidatus Omnitrophota bacterium]|nr:DUF4145 domain-containing protein [Candidatus Omnitrophota bacterium]
MEAYSWTCPFCQQPTTVTDNDTSSTSSTLQIKNKHDFKLLYINWIVCPNVKCKEYSLNVSLFDYLYNPMRGWEVGKRIKSWNLVPASQSRVFPDYIPEAIRNDYLEACLIKDLSPKASATLSRRCLQGMIRDFWGVKQSNLRKAIDKIKNKVDPLTWKAIDAVRKMGNIGSHMEKDINLIIEVDPKEASLLINLIEKLIEEWYIHRHERQATMESIVEMSNEKDLKKKEEKLESGQKIEESSPSEGN